MTHWRARRADEVTELLLKGDGWWARCCSEPMPGDYVLLVLCAVLVGAAIAAFLLLW